MRYEPRMRRWSVVFLLGIAQACVSSNATICPDGRVCPPSTTCEPTRGLCVTDEQLASCVGVADDTVCSFNDRTGLCNGGVWLEAVSSAGGRFGEEEGGGGEPRRGA